MPAKLEYRGKRKTKYELIAELYPELELGDHPYQRSAFAGIDKYVIGFVNSVGGALNSREACQCGPDLVLRDNPYQRSVFAGIDKSVIGFINSAGGALNSRGLSVYR